MNRWEDRLETSDTKAGLLALEQELEQVAAAVPAEQESELSRLRRVIGAANARIEGTDPELLTPGMLANLHSQITAVRANVQQQVNRPTPETPVDLTAANNAADGMLDILGTWPQLPETSQGREMAGLVRQLKKDNTATIKALREEAAGLRESLSQAEEQTTGLVGARDSTLSQLDSKVAELSATIDDQKTRLEIALQEQGQRFDASQDEHRQEHSADVERFKERSKEVLAEQQTAYEDQVEADKALTSALLSDLGAQQAKAEEIVGVIARTGMAGGYQEYAEAEGKQADRFRWMTIVLGIAAVLVLGAEVLFGDFGDVATEALVLKFTFSAALGGLAGYTARQSAHHREAARRARNIQLALASIGPYLQQLDEPKRHAVLQAFSFLFFAPPQGSDAQAEAGPGNLDAFLKILNKEES